MSNEVKDWLTDPKQTASALIAKYPFLRVRDDDDTITWLDFIPTGWREGFGIEMCDKLLEALGDYANVWQITDMKEKWSSIRIYHNGLPSDIKENVDKVIQDYEHISYHTCIVCGAWATGYTTGWVLPFCDKHTFD